jgi:hypothetical protein
MDKAAESINEKYDAQAKALQDVADVNQKILGQQKQQISLADALTQGDISAAAQIAQEARAASADASSVNAENTLQAERQLELDKQRNAAGLTRKQIEEAQFAISQQTFALEEKREVVQASIQIKQDKILAIEKSKLPILTQIKGIEDKIYALEENRERILLDIRRLEDDIYNIKIDQLDPAIDNLKLAEDNLQAVRDELKARLDAIDLQRDAFEAAEDATIAAKITAGQYKDVISATLGLMAGMEQKWRDIAAAAAAAAAQLQLQMQNQQTSFLPSNALFDPVTGESLTEYRPPVETPAQAAASARALDELTSLAQAVDAAQAALDAAELGTDVNKIIAASLALSAALAAYNAFVNASTKSTTSTTNNVSGGGGGDGRFSMQALSSGGMVKPKYFSVGGAARGTDIVPAMLTPGEFVMSKYAVSNYGVDKMKAMNTGSYEGEKVYNYNLSVNVKSDANPDDIARVVMTQIRQIDSQRVRGQRV